MTAGTGPVLASTRGWIRAQPYLLSTSHPWAGEPGSLTAQRDAFATNIYGSLLSGLNTNGMDCVTTTSKIMADGAHHVSR
jgi:hypothetical protein